MHLKEVHTAVGLPLVSFKTSADTENWRNWLGPSLCYRAVSSAPVQALTMGMKIADEALAKGLPGVGYPAPVPRRLEEASAFTRRPIRTKRRFGQQQVAFTLIELLVRSV